MDRPQTRYTKTSDGVSIAYWDIGSGQPIVTVPRMPATHVELEWGVQLRARTLAVSSPVFFAGEPMTPHETVTLFLDGVCVARERPAAGGNSK